MSGAAAIPPFVADDRRRADVIAGGGSITSMSAVMPERSSLPFLARPPKISTATISSSRAASASRVSS